MHARRVLIVLLAALVAVAPAQAQEDPNDPGNDPSSHGGNETAEPDGGGSGDGSSDNGTAGPAPTSSQQGEGPQSMVTDEEGKPCGIFFWSPKDPDRFIIDPDACFLPIIYDLISGY